MGKVVMYSSVSVDGFVADENDQPGPLFDWLSSGDVALDESGEVKVSQTSYDYTRPYWDQIGATLVGRHVFDLTDGWDGKPPSGIDHVVVVTHRPQPEGWDPEAPFHFVDGVEAAMAKAQELAGDRIVEVAAGDVGGQMLAAGLVDEVRMDVVPVVFGSGKRYFGSLHAQHLLEDPDVVTSGQPGASPALSGAPLTDLSGYAKKSTANGDTRSDLRLRLRIAAPNGIRDGDVVGCPARVSKAPGGNPTGAAKGGRDLSGCWLDPSGKMCKASTPDVDASSVASWVASSMPPPMLICRCAASDSTQPGRFRAWSAIRSLRSRATLA